MAGARPAGWSGHGRRWGRLLWRSARDSFADNIPTLGAALAFYTTVAVAPLLVLAVAMAGVVFDDAEARGRVMQEIERLIGPPVADALGAIEPPQESTGSAWGTWASGALLLVGALGVFRRLQDALHVIWRVHPPPDEAWWRVVRRQVFSLSTVVMTGFLLLVSLVVSAGLSWVGGRAASWMGATAWLLEVLNLVVTLSVVTGLFALIFKLLPAVRVPWRRVLPGATLTAVLFTVGKTALGIYLGRASVTSPYGAAGSLVVLLLWCYYAAQIVLFGAEFTRVYAEEKAAEAGEASPARMEEGASSDASQRRSDTTHPAREADPVGP